MPPGDYKKSDEANALWTRYEYTLKRFAMDLDQSVKANAGVIGVYDSNLTLLISDKKWHDAKAEVLSCIDVAAQISIELNKSAGATQVDAARFKTAGAITKVLSRGGFIDHASIEGFSIRLASGHESDIPGRDDSRTDELGGLC